MDDKVKNRKDLFENAPIPKVVAAMGIPTVVSMLVTVIYNMADTYFIGQTNDENQIAAVSIATPVFLIFMALGNLFGIGGSSEIARSLGQKNQKRAKKISAFCCYGGIAVGLVMLAVYMAAMEPILIMIGAKPETMGYARDYLSYVSFGGVFIIFSVAFSNIVRAEGSSKEAMIGNMIGTVVNLVLDPVMILLLGWGVKGAAIATVIGNICASLYYIIYFRKKSTLLSISPRDFYLKGNSYGNVFAIGIPASLNNILMSISNIILNNFLVKYGNDKVAGMGIAMKINMFVVLLQIGLCAGVQPLIAYNYGAGNSDRMKKVIRFTAGSAVGLGCILTLIVVILRMPLVHAFIDKEAVIDAGIMMLQALMVSGPVLGILFTCINTLQGMGEALFSLILTFCRQGLVFVPLLFILDSAVGLKGIIYAQPLADYISIFIATAITIACIKKFDKSLEDCVRFSMKT